MPRDWGDSDDETTAGTGRRLSRAPEPRPAELSGKSALLRRHRPLVEAEPEDRTRPAVRAEPDAWTGHPGVDPHPAPVPSPDEAWPEKAWQAVDDAAIEDAVWPPEPPPIDFHDLDQIRDDLDHELPVDDEIEPPHFDEAATPRIEPVTRPAPSRRSRRRAPQPREAATPSGLTPIVPQQSVAGRALMLVVGIMCFLACLAVGALVLVEDAAHDWQLDISREVTIQVKPVDGKPIEPMLQIAMDLARNTDGVRNVRLMSERDSAGLLEPWLGTGFDYSKLPIPRLVVVELRDPATANLKGLSTQLSAALPNASLDDHSIWAKRLRTMAGTMVAASVVVLVLVLTAMVLSVIFATRAAMAGNRDVVQVLHFVGAEDSFIAGEFQHHFLILGFKGGVGGGIGAMVAFLVAGWVTGDGGGMSGIGEAHALFGGFSVGLHGYLGAAGIVLLVAGLTALTSRLTVRSYLNQLD